MSRTTKVLGFSVPPAVVKEVETLAKQEHRTKSELFREMVRVYHRYRVHRESDEDRWIGKVLAEAKVEQAREPMSLEEMLAENERLARYGAQQAKKLGIKPKDIDRIIHEHRRSRRA
jgi:metal-responsive CopG/Arc/MetJ family transcriptional regulator